MHIKALKIFCDVVGHRSFSRAANENDISQSGASQMVNQLEGHLKVRLIDRSKRPFVLTPEGEVYYRGCRKLVQRLEALEEEVRTLHKEVDGRVSVASIYSVGLSHMDRFVQEFRGKHPKATVRIDYQHPAKVYELVENDKVDIGLVSFPKSSRTIKAKSWREEPIVLVCAPKNRLANRDSVTVDDLQGLDLIGFQQDLVIRHEIDRWFAAERLQMKVVLEFDNIENIKRAIEIDAGVGLLPEPTVQREVQAGTLAMIPIQDCQFVRPLGIIRRHGKELGKTARRFIEMLQQPAASTAIAENEYTFQAASGDNGRSSNGDSLSGNSQRERQGKQPARI